MSMDEPRNSRTSRRLIPHKTKLERHLRERYGELFPRVEFIGTNLETDSRAVVRFYTRGVRRNSGSRMPSKR
jgi:hypothetical protein